MDVHEKYIKRCIALAKNGLGTTYPNPLVGCVIVHEGRIIGEGWHYKAGQPHAEVLAINSVKNKSLLTNATLYVSLEPCSHYGKTPPCADLIIQYNIPMVVIGSIDPFAKVCGKGIDKLKKAGCQVVVPVLEEACKALNKRFFTFHEKKRPYIILKWAQSFDGFIAPATRSNKAPVWITNGYSRQLVHKWRTEEQGILVGTQTVIDDNPQLNARDWYGNNPMRIVLDKKNRIPLENRIFDQCAPTYLINENELGTAEGGVKEVLNKLYEKNIQSVIVEGGAITLEYFINENLWDEARIFSNATCFGKGVSAPKIQGAKSVKHSVLNDELLIVRNND